MKYWLITYSQDSVLGTRLTDNKVINKPPADWLLDMVHESVEDNTILWFSTEITEEQYQSMHGVIG